MDAANVDLKGFTERFYAKRCAGSLEPVLDTLKYLVHETNVWTEITTLLIPGENDSDEELDALTQWVARELKPDVPLHFTAFHPDYRMLETEPTPPPTLQKARAIAIHNGLQHVYVGNVHDPARQATLCPTCGARAISRDGYTIKSYALDASGACASCGSMMAGVFAAKPGAWGRGGYRSTSNATRREGLGGVEAGERHRHKIGGVNARPPERRARGAGGAPLSPSPVASAARTASASAAARSRWARMRADAAAGSRPRIASAMKRCSRTEASSTGRVEHVADLRHDERQLQPRRKLAQLKIVGEPHHRVMERGVLLEIVARVAGPSE